MFNANDFKAPTILIVDCLYEYEEGKLGILLSDGMIEKLNLSVGDCSDFVPAGLKRYESYVDGKLKLTMEFWEILGYECISDYNQDVKNESSTGWVERELMEVMPERWHKMIKKRFDGIAC